jgi:SAM-dependent methyltransferase
MKNLAARISKRQSEHWLKLKNLSVRSGEKNPPQKHDRPTTPMSLMILTGLPGAGKSARLIERVNAATRAGLPVLTFACSEAPVLFANENYRVRRLLGCRQQGLTCALDHFVSTAECAAILERTPPGTLVAFDEAHYFGSELAPYWTHASRRGLEVVLVKISPAQRLQLKNSDPVETPLAIKCQRCQTAEATGYLVLRGLPQDTPFKWWPGDAATVSLCAECEAQMIKSGRQEIVERLERQAPYPGEKTIYQPVELEECKTWKVLRPDSLLRTQLMARIIAERDVRGNRVADNVTYLDVGCNTGYFCHFARHQLGFTAEGVDVVAPDIAVAQLLDTFVRKDNNTFVAADAYDYLRDTPERTFDVTSAFAVFQWLMIQTSVERGVQCLEWLFAKTKQLCFLEMGYTSEEQYKGKLPVTIDRAWVWNLMEQKGGFAEIRMLDAKQHGLMFGSRDIFVGIKTPAPPLCLAAAIAEPAPPVVSAGFASFRCNICGETSQTQIVNMDRESRTCTACGSTLRWRSVIHALSMELFGESLALPDFPASKDIAGIGMTDWEGYAVPLAEKLNYQNTYYHQEPRLDIMDIPAAMEHTLDFIITSDVFEHVPPPISVAFANLRRLLKPGGFVVFTVPYDKAEATREHFPELHDWKIIEQDGVRVLHNRTRDGREQIFDKLVFHGGLGSTLEMRTFSEAGIVAECKRAGLGKIKIRAENFPAAGIYWKYKQSLPIVIRAT